jgi:hypothetical protein
MWLYGRVIPRGNVNESHMGCAEDEFPEELKTNPKCGCTEEEFPCGTKDESHMWL